MSTKLDMSVAVKHHGLPLLRRTLWVLCLVSAPGIRLAHGAETADIQTGTTPMFTESAQRTGLDFVHVNGMTGQFWFPEMMGAGVALFDYDNDGDLDVYLLQGGALTAGKAKGEKHRVGADTGARDRLYRNDLVVNKDGTRRLHFVDVTEQSGIDARGYGMGVASGDIDNDGWVDLYLSNFGANQLWRNNGDGSFRQATVETGLDEPRWTVPVAFVDVDADGWLDLYAGNYVNFTLERNKPCFSPSGARDYCSPLSYDPVADRLWRNRGDGSFEDVSARAGITRNFGGALGVVAADFNGDGPMDIYVGNDGLPNQLWINDGKGRFVDEAFLAGVAVNMDGATEASMGVEAVDFDGDGDQDLFMTHLLGETNTIFVNDGQGWFEDRSLATGLGAPSKAYTSFGIAWTDLDNDGLADLYIANGEVKTIAAQARGGDKYPLKQPNQLFLNRGGGRFEEQSGFVAGGQLAEVSRGVAAGDLDNDGDIDLVVTNNNGPVRLLLNQVGNRRHWLGARVLDRHGRDAYGARVELLGVEGAPALWRRVHTEGSYASARDPRVLFGLGGRATPVSVRVHWLDGAVETWSGTTVDKYITLHRGRGTKEAQHK